MALHFLSVFFVLRSPPCHGAALFRPITLCFLSYSYFRHFGLNHYGPKPSWSVVPCGTRSASAEEMRMHSSEAAKVLGFPKSCARTKNLCKAPSLAGTFRTECVGVGSRATHVIRLVHMRAPVRHNAIDLCQPRGALCTRNRARAHDLGNKNYVIASLKWIWCTMGRCSCSLLFVPHTSIRGNKEFFWDYLEKTSFLLGENGTNCQF